jgi:hypothetical protein
VLEAIEGAVALAVHDRLADAVAAGGDAPTLVEDDQGARRTTSGLWALGDEMDS